MTDAVAPRPAPHQQHNTQPQEAHPDATELLTVIVHGATCLLIVLTGICTDWPGDLPGCGGPAAPEVRPQLLALSPADLVPELVSELASSGVVEQVARGLLVLGGWWRSVAPHGQPQPGSWEGQMQQAQQQQAQQQDQLQQGLASPAAAISFCRDALAHVRDFSSAYQLVSHLNLEPLEGPEEHEDAGGDGVLGQQPQGVLRHSLWPQWDVVDGPQGAPLRRALSGPCAHLLVLAAGLQALCALDGGPGYGTPGPVGQQHLPLAGGAEGEGAGEGNSGGQAQGQGGAPPELEPLCNLVALLAMRPCGAGAGAAEAGAAGAGAGAAGALPAAVEALPCRATRLQLTLRVARAAAQVAARAAAAEGSAADSRQGAGEAEVAVSLAVQALYYAVRHLPPSRGAGPGARRRAALRQWAEAVGEATAVAVRRGGVGGGGDCQRDTVGWEGDVGYRLRALLGLHPHLVGLVTDAGARRSVPECKQTRFVQQVSWLRQSGFWIWAAHDRSVDRSTHVLVRSAWGLQSRRPSAWCCRPSQPRCLHVRWIRDPLSSLQLCCCPSYPALALRTPTRCRTMQTFLRRLPAAPC